jgi:predicted transcriptional regulator of viral defense system
MCTSRRWLNEEESRQGLQRGFVYAVVIPIQSLNSASMAFISPHRKARDRTGRGSVKAHVSDPARTLVDMIAAVEAGGGIDHLADALSTYLETKTADRDLMIRHAGS